MQIHQQRKWRKRSRRKPPHSWSFVEQPHFNSTIRNKTPFTVSPLSALIRLRAEETPTYLQEGDDQRCHDQPLDVLLQQLHHGVVATLRGQNAASVRTARLRVCHRSRQTVTPGCDRPRPQITPARRHTNHQIFDLWAPVCSIGYNDSCTIFLHTRGRSGS